MPRLYRRLLVALSIAAFAAAGARDAGAWQTVITPSYGVDGALLVAFDGDRNVVAAGETLVSGDTRCSPSSSSRSMETSGG